MQLASSLFLVVDEDDLGFLFAEGGSNEGGINRDSLDVEVKS